MTCRPTRSRCTSRACARSSSPRESGSAPCAASATCSRSSRNRRSNRMARSLRAHLLRLLLPPIAALLVVGAIVAYYPSMEPATEAYNQALVDVGIALGSYVRVTDTGYGFELPPAVEQVLRTDRYDIIYYSVVAPDGRQVGGDPDLPPPPDASGGSYDAEMKGQRVHVVSVQAPCGASVCNIFVAETTVKRSRLTRDILFSSLIP